LIPSQLSFNVRQTKAGHLPEQIVPISKRAVAAAWILWPVAAVGLPIVVLFSEVVLSHDGSLHIVEFAVSSPQGTGEYLMVLLCLALLVVLLLGPPLALTVLRRKQLRALMPRDL